MIRTSMLCSLIAATTLSLTASADPSIAQKQKRKTWQEQIDSHSKSANDRCGASIAVTVEWEGFEAAMQTAGEQAIGMFCGDPIEAVAGVCQVGGDDAKAAVKQKIHKYVCRYGGEGKRSIDVSSGTFTFTVDLKKGSNIVDIRNDLMKKL